MGKIIHFPFERTRAFHEWKERLKDVTSWWPSKAEQARETHRAALGYLPRQEKPDAPDKE